MQPELGPNNSAWAEPGREPLSSAELQGLLLRPDRLPDLMLAGWRRILATVQQRRHLALLIIVMVTTSAVVCLPYGTVIDPARLWRLPVMYLGTVLVCFPSLHVFGTYLGRKAALGQDVAIALTTSAVASLFTFAFFPIVWFLRVTMPKDAIITTASLSAVMLFVALGAGIVYALRCMLSGRKGGDLILHFFLMTGWVALVLMIAGRMASWLDLLG